MQISYAHAYSPYLLGVEKPDKLEIRFAGFTHGSVVAVDLFLHRGKNFVVHFSAFVRYIFLFASMTTEYIIAKNLATTK